MAYRELIPALVPLLRPGGGIAVITNGTPMWLQPTPWSQALRRFLAEWLGSTPAGACGTDDASQRRYRETLAEARLEVAETRYEYTDELDLDRLVGGGLLCAAGRAAAPAGSAGGLRRPDPRRGRPARAVHRAGPGAPAARASHRSLTVSA
ncbi:MAG TPA: hypothetical protein VHZ33_20800 [Trebonia sp.]|jgi:hypothetical protein|nr:hypothetical protein [Trebonia sp.]